MITDFLTALVLVFASEMGDKSQIVTFGFGTQHRLIVVLPAIFLGIAVMLGASALIGEAAGSLIPYFWMHILSGVLFFVFAYLSFIGEHEDEHKEVGTKFGAFVAIFLTFVISELGDKTIFATMTLASHSKNFLAVWLGATLGMFAADVLAIVVANLLGKALPPKATRIASAIVFVLAGVATFYEAFAKVQ
ncbi:MAG TPA: TMEM165/GDT1 family protein [Planktothrix sp.]|jgi:putative Ca2+/H+ antiporter (TMEM165/GDT1 family)